MQLEHTTYTYFMKEFFYAIFLLILAHIGYKYAFASLMLFEVQ